MKTNFSIGSRIKISEGYSWAKNAIGTVSTPPDVIREISEGWKDNCREVKTLKGKVICYWIKFDRPHFDSDGDGPYSEAEIESEYLCLLSEK
jgi:hypothetical protein